MLYKQVNAQNNPERRERIPIYVVPLGKGDWEMCVWWTRGVDTVKLTFLYVTVCVSYFSIFKK